MKGEAGAELTCSAAFTYKIAQARNAQRNLAANRSSTCPTRPRLENLVTSSTANRASEWENLFCAAYLGQQQRKMSQQP